MKKIKGALSVFLLLGFGLAVLKAQEAIPASGGNATGSGGSVSYSVGQIVYTTKTGGNHSLTEGVQQPYEISEIIRIKETKGITIQCTAYPNPTNDLLNLKIDASTKLRIQSLSYQLCDINGKLLRDKKIEGNETGINMNNLAPATYLLKVTDNKKVIKSFKIIKN